MTKRKEPEPIAVEPPICVELRDAVPDATSPVDYLEELDRRLALQGWPETSEWWRDVLHKFYRTTALQLVLRVGRRGGKSSTLCRVAVLEALMGDHHVAPGDTAVVPIVSVNKPEARERLATIEKILLVLGVRHKPVADRIDLVEKDVAFRVFSGTVGGVSGFSGICVICDEVSKWLDVDTGVNPATEVLASIRPTMAGLPNARLFLSSSPMTNGDAHAKAFDEGDSEFQQVAFAETWVARPTLTREMTLRLEKNAKKWEREYAAIPQEGVEGSLFSAAALTACTREAGKLPRVAGVEYAAAMAPTLAHGTWSLVIAARFGNGPKGRGIVHLQQWDDPEPRAVLIGVKAALSEYGLADTLSTSEGRAHLELAASLGVHIRISTTPIAELANGMLARLATGEDDLHPSQELRDDLLSLRLAESEIPGAFAVRVGDVERYPAFAVPAMLALHECGRLTPPKGPRTVSFASKLLADLVSRNKSLYDAGEE